MITVATPCCLLLLRQDRRRGSDLRMHLPPDNASTTSAWETDEPLLSIQAAMGSIGTLGHSVSVGPTNAVESALPCPSVGSLLDVVPEQSSPSDRSVSVGLSSQYIDI
jgi:hypothetical protein